LAKESREKNDNRVSKLEIAFIIFLLVAVPGTIYYVTLTSVDRETEIRENDPDISFPAVEVTFIDNRLQDELRIKHVKGDPLDWSEFEIYIMNKANSSDFTKMRDLGSLGILDQGEISIFNSSIEGFGGMDFHKDQAYYLQVSHIEEGFVVAKRNYVFCE
jgi:hypothetical protein